jgi:hypothetical protein
MRGLLRVDWLMPWCAVAFLVFATVPTAAQEVDPTDETVDVAVPTDDVAPPIVVVQDNPATPPATDAGSIAPDVKATLLMAPPGNPLLPSGKQPNSQTALGFSGSYIVDSTPSPVGAPLFTTVALTVIGPFSLVSDGIGVEIQLDPDRARYQYGCPSGTCEGFAADVWRAMPPPQRENYLNVLADRIAPGVAPRRPWFLVEITHYELIPGRPPNKMPVVLSAIKFELGSGTKTYAADYPRSGQASAWLSNLP